MKKGKAWILSSGALLAAALVIIFTVAGMALVKLPSFETFRMRLSAGKKEA